MYVSRPFGYDSAMLSGILLSARRNNPPAQITGALVCRQDVFLQLLEGPRDKVTALYDQIVRDDRHVDVKQLYKRAIAHRMFGDWAMLHDPAQSWIWSQEQMQDGMLDRATETEVIVLFETLAERVKTDRAAAGTAT